MEWMFPDGVYQDIGLTFASVIFHVLALSLKHRITVTVMVCWHTILRKVFVAEIPLDGLNVLALADFKVIFGLVTPK